MKRGLWLVLGAALAVAMLLSACGDDEGTADATPSDGDVLSSVTAALEAKYGWDEGAATVTLDTVEDERFAKGGVTDPEGSGALWFASLVDGEWRIVFDGNGIVDCASLEPYPDFPTSMLPQCVDAGGNLQTR
ncbi:MAG: hypothetical protein R3C39_13725 [Dehalococcoidia bacterium]